MFRIVFIYWLTTNGAAVHIHHLPDIYSTQRSCSAAIRVLYDMEESYYKKQNTFVHGYGVCIPIENTGYAPSPEPETSNLNSKDEYIHLRVK